MQNEERNSNFKMTTYSVRGRVVTDKKPSRKEAEAAVRILLKWAGDDPTQSRTHCCINQGGRRFNCFLKIGQSSSCGGRR